MFYDTPSKIAADLRREMQQMGFVKAASAKELKPSSMEEVEINGKPVLLLNLEGRYYAIGNVCTHMACMLSDGVLNEEPCSVHATAQSSISRLAESCRDPPETSARIPGET